MPVGGYRYFGYLGLELYYHGTRNRGVQILSVCKTLILGVSGSAPTFHCRCPCVQMYSLFFKSVHLKNLRLSNGKDARVPLF